MVSQTFFCLFVSIGFGAPIPLVNPHLRVIPLLRQIRCVGSHMVKQTKELIGLENNLYLCKLLCWYTSGSRR